MFVSVWPFGCFFSCCESPAGKKPHSCFQGIHGLSRGSPDTQKPTMGGCGAVSAHVAADLSRGGAGQGGCWAHNADAFLNRRPLSLGVFGVG